MLASFLASYNKRYSLLNGKGTKQIHHLIVARIASIAAAADQANDAGGPPPPLPPSEQQPPPLSKKAQRRQQRLQGKAEKRASRKEEKKREFERKRREWEEKLSVLSQSEGEMIESRNVVKKERMERRLEERESKILRLSEAKKHGQNIVVDLEFSQLMAPNEIYSLARQIMYCYAVNGRSMFPAHLWLTGYEGEIRSQLQKLPGFDKWMIEKEQSSYINTFESQKEHLVYLTPDSETMLSELDPKKVYIVGGLVDRTMRKGITMAKAKEQGIQTAKLPLRNYLKMPSSHVLTVNQVIEILLKFLETKDWRASVFHVIPQRKRCEADHDESHEAAAKKG